MEEKAYHYAQMEPKQLDKLRQAEKDLDVYKRQSLNRTVCPLGKKTDFGGFHTLLC